MTAFEIDERIGERNGTGLTGFKVYPKVKRVLTKVKGKGGLDIFVGNVCHWKSGTSTHSFTVEAIFLGSDDHEYLLCGKTIHGVARTYLHDYGVLIDFLRYRGLLADLNKFTNDMKKLEEL